MVAILRIILACVAGFIGFVYAIFGAFIITGDSIPVGGLIITISLGLIFVSYKLFRYKKKSSNDEDLSIVEE